MLSKILVGIFIPFLGTIIGSGAVFCLKSGLSDRLTEILNGFAAGVMFAASIWSLLIPAFSYSDNSIIVVIGFLAGVFSLALLDRAVFKIYSKNKKRLNLSGSNLFVAFVVALHNLPEGIAVGVVFAEYLLHGSHTAYTTAIALSLGIAIQNLPEGAIISCPLYASGTSKCSAFSLGAASGIVEPIGAIFAIAAIGVAINLLPFLLSFTAGAMIYVTVKNLIPEFTLKGRLCGTAFFSLGFSLMMFLDVSL